MVSGFKFDGILSFFLILHNTKKNVVPYNTLQCVLYGTALENYLEASTGVERCGASSYWHQLLDVCDITVPGAFGVLLGAIQSARCHF